MEGHIRFAELLELHITNQINKKFVNATADNKTLHEMRDVVKDQVFTVFGKSSHKVTEAGLNWLVNQIFKNLQLSSKDADGKTTKTAVYELVIFNEYNLADLPYSDIQLLRNLFSQAPYGQQLEEEYKSRSAA